MKRLHDVLATSAANGLVSTGAQQEASRLFGLSFAEIEAEILSLGLFPARYQRNRKSISCDDQLVLLRSRVAVIGCGGLGGYLLEELARLGVGSIVAVDPDCFEEHNLNRQLLSRIDNLGEPKVTAAALRVAQINPAVDLVPRQERFGEDNGRDILAGATVAVDALDNLTSRLQLAATCSKMGIPMVHGAIAGWYGQLATQLQGQDISPYLASAGGGAKGVETSLGNPSFTPAVVASLQVAEVCKLILGRPGTVSGRMLVANLLEMEFEEIRL